jgi:hypothetical protein
MRLRTQSFSATALIFLSAILCTQAHAFEKLKGFYSGSGGLSQQVHRVVMIEFATDGTAILQQNWEGKDPQTWHGHWTQENKNVKITFDTVKDHPTPDPLLLNLKHGTLAPTSWDATALGVLGPPKFTPFGGKNVQQNTVAACQAINSNNPTHNCVTWDSRDNR